MLNKSLIFSLLLLLLLTLVPTQTFAEEIKLCDALLLGHKNSGLSNEPIVIPLERVILRAGNQMDIPDISEVIKDPDIANNYFAHVECRLCY